jgi:hypothetical protein
MALSRRSWAVVAIALGIVLLYAGTSYSVYRHTLPHRIIERIFGDDPGEAWFSPTFYIRKSYSIAAFTLMGAVSQLALPPARWAVVRGALLVAAFSALIEVAQKLHGAPEGLGWSAFDVGCGAVGGALGVSAVTFVARRRGGSSRR